MAFSAGTQNRSFRADMAPLNSLGTSYSRPSSGRVLCAVECVFLVGSMLVMSSIRIDLSRTDVLINVCLFGHLFLTLIIKLFAGA